MPIPLPDALDESADLAATKAMQVRALPRFVVSSALAGAFIGVAVVLLLSVAGPMAAASSASTKLVSGAVFGIALTLVVFAGAELFTGNVMVMVHGVWARRATPMQLLAVWVATLAGNFVGSIGFAALVSGELTLRRLFTGLHREFGAAVLVDCHSMPSNAGQRDERARPEFVLGDRYGTSCVDVVADVVEQTLREQGYTVSRNKPYAGGFITEHYGNPAAGLHAIQLEINRALYMDERRHQKVPGFSRVAADMDLVARRLGDIPLEELRPYRAAAAE